MVQGKAGTWCSLTEATSTMPLCYKPQLQLDWKLEENPSKMNYEQQLYLVLYIGLDL